MYVPAASRVVVKILASFFARRPGEEDTYLFAPDASSQHHIIGTVLTHCTYRTRVQNHGNVCCLLNFWSKVMSYYDRSVAVHRPPETHPSTNTLIRSFEAALEFLMLRVPVCMYVFVCVPVCVPVCCLLYTSDAADE